MTTSPPAVVLCAFMLGLAACESPAPNGARTDLARTPSAASPVAADIDARIRASEAQLVAWRRHLHEHPELSNREVETARYVADALRAMGLEPRTGIARNGVVAVIEGGRPGVVVAVRADMDALPVKEDVDVP